MDSTATEHHDAPAAGPTPQEQRVLAAKIAGGFVMGFIMSGIVGPIALAIFVGLVTGHT